MTFGILGNFIQGTSDLAAGGISLVHRTADDTLDHIGLGAFIPPAVHEVSDGALGLIQRGVLDVGHTSGAVLRSFDGKTLHGADKEIGGNLRQKQAKAVANQHSPSKPKKKKVSLCKWCREEPRVADFDYCSKHCANKAQRSRH